MLEQDEAAAVTSAAAVTVQVVPPTPEPPARELRAVPPVPDDPVSTAATEVAAITDEAATAADDATKPDDGARPDEAPRVTVANVVGTACEANEGAVALAALLLGRGAASLVAAGTEPVAAPVA